MTTFTCTRCEEEISVDERCGTEDKPYCRFCHMIVFYRFPEARLKKIEDELERMRRMGTPEERLAQILWNELSRHAKREINDNLQGFTVGRLARVLRG